MTIQSEELDVENFLGPAAYEAEAVPYYLEPTHLHWCGAQDGGCHNYWKHADVACEFEFDGEAVGIDWPCPECVDRVREG